MSGYGLSGFGTGFLQGFEAMGKNFAERGVLDADRQKQLREDRKLQMEQELEKLREERLSKEVDSQSRYRDLQSRELEERLPHVGADAQATVEGKALKNQRDQIENGSLQEKIAAGIKQDQSEAGLRDAQAESQRLKNTEEQQVQTYHRDLSGSLGRLLDGSADDVDMRRAMQTIDMAGMEGIPEHLKNFHDASMNYVAAAQRGDANADDAFNNPQTLSSINAAMKVGIDKNKGLLLDPAGTKMIQGSEVVRLVRNPKDNRLGAVLRVQPAPTPDRRKELEAQLETANPDQAVAIEKELHPPAYEQMLTDGRTPMDMGGKALWFAPQDINRMFTDLQGIGEWQAQNPDLVREVRSMKAQIDSGQYGHGDSGKALDREIKIRAENRANRREARETTRDQRNQTRDAFNTASRMIDKEYSDPSIYGGESLTGNSAAQANAEKRELDRVLKESPGLSGAEAYGLVKERMKKNTPAPSGNAEGASASGPSPAAQRLMSRYR